MRTRFRLPLHAAAVSVWLAGCIARPLEPVLWPEVRAALPTESTADYRPRPVLAHAALPLFDEAAQRFRGSSRLWVKGSDELCVVHIGSADGVRLAPPHYTATLGCEPGPNEVVFEASIGSEGRAPVTCRVEVVLAHRGIEALEPRAERLGLLVTENLGHCAVARAALVEDEQRHPMDSELLVEGRHRPIQGRVAGARAPFELVIEESPPSGRVVRVPVDVFVAL